MINHSVAESEKKFEHQKLFKEYKKGDASEKSVIVSNYDGAENIKYIDWKWLVIAI